jgi:hypothetical protein
MAPVRSRLNDWWVELAWKLPDVDDLRGVSFVDVFRNARPSKLLDLGFLRGFD